MWLRDHWVKTADVFNKVGNVVKEKTNDVYLAVVERPDKYKKLMQMVKDYDYPIEKHFYEC